MKAWNPGIIFCAVWAMCGLTAEDAPKDKPPAVEYGAESQGVVVKLEPLSKDPKDRLAFRVTLKNVGKTPLEMYGPATKAAYRFTLKAENGKESGVFFSKIGENTPPFTVAAQQEVSFLVRNENGVANSGGKSTPLADLPSGKYTLIAMYPGMKITLNKKPNPYTGQAISLPLALEIPAKDQK